MKYFLSQNYKSSQITLFIVFNDAARSSEYVRQIYRLISE
jgi:hypothetical protein